MVTELIKKANNYASKSNFNDKIKRFKIDKNKDNYDWEKCDEIYKEYKKLCNFDKILEFGYLFEKKSDLYNNLKYKIIHINDEEEFRNIYRNHLGDIYKKIFGNLPLKSSLLEKVTDANDKVINLYNCVENRIKYHFWCKNHQQKYNVKTHEHEILISIYMYNRIIDIKELLNEYRDKYLKFKDNLKKEKDNLKKEIKKREDKIKEREELLDNLSSESSKPLSEPFITNFKKEKRI